jgi:hypothetical protein
MLRPSFYANFLKPALRESLNYLAAASPQEQLNLYEELQLVRSVAGHAVQMYAEAVELLAAAPLDIRVRAMVFETGEAMKSHLRDVVDIAEKIARIENGAKDKVSIAQLHFFLDSILRCSHQVYADDEEKALQFAELIRTQIKLPQVGITGTTLTPDLDVLAMDASVPEADNVSSTNSNGSNGHVDANF